MPLRISWSKLYPGLMALAAVAVVGTGVLLFAAAGPIRGEKIRLYFLTDQARGIMRGSEVWLAGQPIGVVEAVTFRPPASDSTTRLVIAASVSKKDARQIRQDSRVQVRSGANVVGPIVVYVSAGTPSSPALHDGDTLRARPQSDVEVAAMKLDTAMDALRPIVTDARAVLGHVGHPSGTVGAMRAEGGGIAQLRDGTRRVRELFLGRRADHAERDFVARTRSAFARVDSIRTLLRAGHTSLGRFRRDSSFGAAVDAVRDEVAELRAALERAEGTLGRFATDSALARSMAQIHREMKFLSDDVRRRPLRYVHF